MKYTGRVGLPILAFISWLFIILYSYLVYRKVDYIFLSIANLYIVFGWVLGKNYDTAKFYSEKDDLTQVYTRRYALDTLFRLLLKMGQNRKELSLFIVDVDKFKQINDTYGHNMGDKVLINIARLLKKCTRNTDYVARWGGDEFLIIAPDTNENVIVQICNMIEEQLKEISLEIHLELTLSVGVSKYPTDAVDIDSLICVADQSMYSEKLVKINTKRDYNHQNPDFVITGN